MADNQNQLKKTPSPRIPRVAVLPALITLLNALFGFAAIHFAARGMMNEPGALLLKKPPLTFFETAAWMIFLAMIADAFDGFVARKSGSASDFGAQLDSLSDVISFGIAPAFLMLRLVESVLNETFHPASPVFGSLPGRLLWFVGALYLCCAALRLARFNVESSIDESSHMIFKGLPSPAAAGVIASLVLLFSEINSKVVIYILPVMTIIVALLMVSSIPFAHIANRFFKGRKPFEYVVLLVFICLVIFWKPQYNLSIVGLIYVASGLVPWLLKKIRKKVPAHLPTSQSQKKTRQHPPTD